MCLFIGRGADSGGEPGKKKGPAIKLGAIEARHGTHNSHGTENLQRKIAAERRSCWT
jgi:hypothetical protein